MIVRRLRMMYLVYLGTFAYILAGWMGVIFVVLAACDIEARCVGCLHPLWAHDKDGCTFCKRLNEEEE